MQVSVESTGTSLVQLTSLLLERRQCKAVIDIFGNVFVKKDHMLERSFIQYGLDVFVESPVGNEDRSRTGIGKNVINLVERLRGVDGNVDRAETEDREIGDGPLGTILRKQRNAIARSHSQ